ncbi:hypothetical protein OR1_04197 [Geobacter sp. OR-1]|nr:hypothetical protein OR1_04197 [Geobacter sp. OR-1]
MPFQLLELRHRPHSPDLFGQLGDYLDPFPTLGSRYPGELEPVQIDPDKFQELSEGGKPPPGVEVAGHVVAVARVATGNQDAVGPFLEGPQDEDRVDPAGAGELHHPDIARVLHPAGAGQVGPGIGAPGADKGHYLGFEVVFQFLSMHANFLV